MTRHGTGRCGAATGPLPVLMLLATAGLAGTARAEEPPVADPALVEILEEHRAEVGRLETRYLAARRERERATLARLKTLQDEHCRQARLDEALAVREEIRRIERQSAEGLARTDAPVPAAPDTLGWMPLQPGQTFDFTVTGSTQGPVWGTDLYTTDSRVAAAAVHAGALAVGETGVVRITVVESPAEHTASVRHGVSSGRWGRYRTSYRVERIDAAPHAPAPPPTESRAPKGVPLTPLVPALPIAPRARRLERAPERAREPAPERTRVPVPEQRPAEDARTPPPDAAPARRPFD